MCENKRQVKPVQQQDSQILPCSLACSLDGGLTTIQIQYRDPASIQWSSFSAECPQLRSALETKLILLQPIGFNQGSGDSINYAVVSQSSHWSPLFLISTI